MKYILPGNPIPAARPRLSAGHVYSPHSLEKTKRSLLLAHLHGNKPLFSTPLHVELVFYVQVPDKMSNKKKELYLSRPYHNIRQDIDNLAKFFLDVANKVLWEDDALVVSLVCKKMHAREGRTEIIVELIEDYDGR